jgi:hypothetical protein
MTNVIVTSYLGIYSAELCFSHFIFKSTPVNRLSIYCFLFKTNFIQCAAYSRNWLRQCLVKCVKRNYAEFNAGELRPGTSQVLIEYLSRSKMSMWNDEGNRL